MSQRHRRENWTIYYDGRCGLCVFLVRLLAWADFFRQLAWVNFRDLERPPEGLTWEDLETAAYLQVSRTGPVGDMADGNTFKMYRGFYAFRMIALRLPLLLPLAPVAWLPGMGWLGERAYAWVAANRHHISRRCRLKA